LLIKVQISCSMVGHIIRGRKRPTYIHFDSYPSGFGLKIVEFIKSLSTEQIDTKTCQLETLEWQASRQQHTTTWLTEVIGSMNAFHLQETSKIAILQPGLRIRMSAVGV